MKIVSRSNPNSILLPFPQGWMIDDWAVQFFPGEENPCLPGFTGEHWRVHHPNGDWLNIFREDKVVPHF